MLESLTNSAYLSCPRSHHKARWSPRQINPVGPNPPRGGRYGDCKRQYGRYAMTRQARGKFVKWRESRRLGVVNSAGFGECIRGGREGK